MLGTDVCQALVSAGHEAIATDLVNAPHPMDITSPASVREAFTSLSPESVIHCAAYTAVDRAETDVESAFRVNALGSSVLAQAARRANIPILAIGTDYVFRGDARKPYHEFARPDPVGVYACSKLAGEEEIRRHCPEHWIVRTAWLYGLHGKCFPETILKRAEERPREPLRVVADQFGSPTFAQDLASLLPRFFDLPYGNYHGVNAGVASWYEFASHLVREAGYDSTPVVPVPTSDWPALARRPAFSALQSLRLEAFGIAPLRDWREAACDYLRLRVKLRGGSSG